ncbi:hypothetical protein JCM10207_005185 [Rhodosporidiobolus poonsookiae]
MRFSLLPLLPLPLLVFASPTSSSLSHALEPRQAGIPPSFSLSPDRLSCICRAGKVKSVNGQQCRTSCESGAYPVGDGTCAACPAPFAKCASADKATGCIDGWFLSGSTCVEACPPGTWGDASPGRASLFLPPSRALPHLSYTLAENRCRSCTDKDAATCSNGGAPATACLTKYLHNGACIDAARVPDGFFADSTTHKAVACDAGVKTCIGSGPGLATSCGKTKKGDQLLLTPTAKCELHCPRGFWGNKKVGACLPCDSTELTCDAGGANTCAKDSAGKQLFLTSTRRCVLPYVGPAGFWPDESTSKFKPCDDGVTTCVGTGGGAAMSCGKRADGTPVYFTPAVAAVQLPTLKRYALRLRAFELLGECVEASACPAETWADPVTSTCVACDSDETACSKNGEGSALSCKTGRYLSASKDCLTANECQASGAFFPDDETNACSTCDPGEAACTDNGVGFATACATNENGDQLFLQDGDWQECRACDEGALTCTGTGAALTCGFDGAGKMLYLKTDGMCVGKTGCSAGSWADPATRKCESCKLLDEDAATCTGPFMLTCTNLFLQSGACVPASDCITGTYPSSASHECMVCAFAFPHSLTCTEAGASTCAQPYLLYQGRCLSSCPAGTRKDGSGCVPCADGVATCDATGALTCNAGYKYFIEARQCVTTCPEKVSNGCAGGELGNLCKATYESYGQCRSCTKYAYQCGADGYPVDCGFFILLSVTPYRQCIEAGDCWARGDTWRRRPIQSPVGNSGNWNICEECPAGQKAVLPYRWDCA